MNVLLVHEAAVPGGLETRLLAHIRALRARGHRVFSVRRDGCLSEAFDREGVVQFDLDFLSRAAFAGTVTRLRSLLREHAIGFCDVHTHWPQLPASLAAMAERIPFSLNFHGLWLNDSIEFQNQRFLPLLAKYAAFSTANSPETAAFLGRRAPDITRRLLVVPNTIDVEAYAALPPAGLKIRRLVIISRLDQDKEASLEAAVRFVRGWASEADETPELRLCGDGNVAGRFRSELRGLAEQGLVHFESRGAVESSVNEIGWADAVLGLGRVALEGIAAARPTILCGATGKLVGLVTPDNVDALFAYNLAGRNADEPELASVLRAVREVAPSDTSRLQDWARAHVGPDRLKEWLDEVDAAAGTRPSEEAAAWAIAATGALDDLFHALADLAGMDVRLKAMQGELAASDVRNNELAAGMEAKLKALRGELEASDVKVKALQDELEASHARRKVLLGKVAAGMDARLKALRAELAESDARNTALQQRIESQEAEFEALNRHFWDMADWKDRAEVEMAQLADALSSRGSRLGVAGAEVYKSTRELMGRAVDRSKWRDVEAARRTLGRIGKSLGAIAEVLRG